MTGLSRFLTWMFTFSIIAILFARAYVLFANPTPDALGRVQIFLGVIPEKLTFQDCLVDIKNVMYAESVRYENGRHMWLFGLFPLKGEKDGVSRSMYVLGALDEKRVTLNTLSDAEQAGIERGMEACLERGACKSIANALSSKKMGFLVESGTMRSLVIPELGIRVSTNEPQFPNWFYCKS